MKDNPLGVSLDMRLSKLSVLRLKDQSSVWVVPFLVWGLSLHETKSAEYQSVILP